MWRSAVNTLELCHVGEQSAVSLAVMYIHVRVWKAQVYPDRCHRCFKSQVYGADQRGVAEGPRAQGPGGSKLLNPRAKNRERTLRELPPAGF